MNMGAGLMLKDQQTNGLVVLGSPIKITKLKKLG